MFYYNKPFNFLMLNTLIISSLMTISSSNWLFLWMAMELNLLSFIPMITNTKSSQETEAAVKYFMAQAIGSSLMLMSSFTLWLSSTTPSLMSLILMSSLILKLGMAPFHFWFPPVMASISWISCLILSTWQKLAPLFILSFIFEQMLLIPMSIIAVMNAIIGGMIGMNQTHLRSIMAYSSLTHMGWMTSMLIINKPMSTISYFILYSLIILPLFIIFNSTSSSYHNQLSKIMNHSPIMQLLIPMLLMSLSGLPPLTGFIPKWITISTLSHISPIMITFLILGAMMNLYFYLNIMFSSILNINSSTNSIMNNKLNLKLTYVISISSILLFPLMLMLYAMTILY